MFFFSIRRRHTRCALVTGVQTCALPISTGNIAACPSPYAANMQIAAASLSLAIAPPLVCGERQGQTGESTMRQIDHHIVSGAGGGARKNDIFEPNNGGVTAQVARGDARLRERAVRPDERRGGKESVSTR